MSYRQTIDFLYSRLPVYHRVGEAAYKANLNNIKKLCDFLDNPQKKIKTIHVAGTNGKGSVSHIMAAILQSHGYKTGLYTSPHLKDFRERIKIDGEQIDKDFVSEFVEDYRANFTKVEPSFFELTCAMAFQYFYKKEVDIAVIETGLGGRLDSTNVIQPEVSVITNIGIDHILFLGNTLEQIATEKAGIIKENTPVVIGCDQKEVSKVFKTVSQKNKAKLYFAHKEYKVVSYQTGFQEKPFSEIQYKIRENKSFKVKTDLTGIFQAENIATSLMALKTLNSFMFNELTISKALLNVTQLNGLSGRWQIIQKLPYIVLDVAHNIDGIANVIKNLSYYSYHNLHIVFGCSNDKNVHGILSQFNEKAQFYFCEANIPRSYHKEDLVSVAKNMNKKCKCYNSPVEAFKTAKNNAKENDFVLVTGSFFIVGELI